MLGLDAGGVLGLETGALGRVGGVLGLEAGALAGVLGRAGDVLGLEAGALGRGAGGVLGLGAVAGLATGFGGFLASNTAARY